MLWLLNFLLTLYIHIIYTNERLYVIQIYKVCSICELHVFVSPWLWRRITSGIWGNPPDQRPEKIQSGDTARPQPLQYL
jgi:hypothetical protein